MKCDEAKPDCHRCTSTGRKCDGYFNSVSVPRGNSSACSPQAVPSFAPNSTALEKKAFEWFRYQTVPILSGHFPDETYDRTTLQLYFSEPAVRYVVNAFGALHHEVHFIRLACNGGIDSNLRTHSPAEQYSRALQELQNVLSLREIPIEVVVVCSLLLVQFEGLQQSFLPAMLHAEKALHLLTCGDRKIDERLLRTIMRFDAQSAMHAGRKPPQLTAYTSNLDRALPPALTSAVQARHLVNTWSSRLYAFSQAVADHYVIEPGDIALEHLAQAQELEQVVVRLDRLLSSFREKRGEKLTLREQHGLNVFQARAKILRIFAATCLYAEATMLDDYLDDFKEILSICTSLMSDPHADRRLFVLHVDEGLMHPLYVVATYCRDSRIRHAAFDLLRELPAGNGLRIWHANVVFRTARAIIQFEEAGNETLRCEDVPEWRRVHDASFNNWDQASWHSTIGGPLRVRPNGTDGEWMDLRELMEFNELSESQTVDLLDTPLNTGVIA